MPFEKKRPRKKELMPLDARKIFIGRESELSFFREHILFAEDVSHNIIAVAGQGGVGKSTLLGRFIEETRHGEAKEYCLTAFIDERQSSIINILEQIADQLNLKGEFEKAITQYHEALRKLRLERHTAREDVWRHGLNTVSEHTLKEVPVVGDFLHKGAEATIGYVFDEIHYHHLLEDSKRLEDPITTLTRSCIDELNKVASQESQSKSKRPKRILLFFDTYEKLASEVTPWLLEKFLSQSIDQNIVLVIAGREPLAQALPGYAKQWLPFYDDDILHQIHLETFTLDETRKYLLKKGIDKENRALDIFQMSHGLPFYLSLLTTHPNGDFDPTSNVVDNILKWVPENEKIKRRLALDAALLSRPFNQDDLAAFPYFREQEPVEQDKLYQWLLNQEFIRTNSYDGLHRYHDVAHEIFDRSLYQRSHKTYIALRRQIIEFYQTQLNVIPLNNDEIVSSQEQWFSLSLALIYQYFTIPEESACISGTTLVIRSCYYLRETDREADKEAFRKGLYDLHQISKKHPLYAKNEKILESLLHFWHYKQKSGEFLESVQFLLQKLHPHQSEEKHALAILFSARAKISFRRKDGRKALEDIALALELTPASANCYFSQASYYKMLGQLDLALNAINKALALRLDHDFLISKGDLLTRRGEHHQAQEIYEQADITFPEYVHVNKKRLGSIFNLRGYYQEAISALKLSLQNYSSCQYAWDELFKSYMTLYSRKQAPGLLLNAMAIMNEDVHLVLARVFFEYEYYREAWEQIRKAETIALLDSRHLTLKMRILIFLKKYDEAIAVGSQLIQIDGKYTHYIQENHGYIQMQRKNYQQAVHYFVEAIESHALCEDSWDQLAKAYNGAGLKHEQFSDFLLQISVSDPYEPLLPIMRAIALRSLGMFAEALREMNHYAHNGQRTALFYRVRALLYTDLEQFQEAVQDWNQVVVGDLEEKHIAFKAMGELYTKMGSPERAIPAFVTSLLEHIECQTAWNGLLENLGTYHYRRWEQEILAMLEPLLKSSLRSPDFLHQRFHLHLILGNNQHALDDWDGYCWKVDADDNDWCQCGLLQSRLGNYPQAIHAYQKFDHDITNAYNIAVVMVRWRGLKAANQVVRKLKVCIYQSKMTEEKKYVRAGMAALQRETEKALKLLDQVSPEALYWAFDDIAWDELREDPRFQDILAKVQ